MFIDNTSNGQFVFTGCCFLCIVDCNFTGSFVNNKIVCFYPFTIENNCRDDKFIRNPTFKGGCRNLYTYDKLIYIRSIRIIKFKVADYFTSIIRTRYYGAEQKCEPKIPENFDEDGCNVCFIFFLLLVIMYLHYYLPLLE